MDATRLHDHKRVTLKPKERSHEPDIMFSPEEVERNPRNHCVPLLEIIEIPDSGQRIMVLPYLQHLGDFQTFAEFVEFFTQICEVGSHLVLAWPRPVLMSCHLGPTIPARA
jgi:hypothetical protein